VIRGLTNVTRDGNHQISACHFEISQDVIVAREHKGGFISDEGSSFELPLNVTGITTADLTIYNYAGIFNVQGGATENIDNIIIDLAIRIAFTFIPDVGLTLTITGTAYASINANGAIMLPTTDIELRGDLRESITFKQQEITNGNGTFSVLVQVDANTYQ
jgi:hypothetical protein